MLRVQSTRRLGVVAIRAPKRRRTIDVFTCDRGHRELDLDGAPAHVIDSTLQEVVESGFWRELDKFPADVIARALPHLSLPSHTRRLLEIWIEERAESVRVA